MSIDKIAEQRLIPLPHPRNHLELPAPGRHRPEHPDTTWSMRGLMHQRPSGGLERLGDIIARLHIEHPTFKTAAVRAAELKAAEAQA